MYGTRNGGRSGVVPRSMMQPPSSFIIDTVMGSRDPRQRVGWFGLLRCESRIRLQCACELSRIRQAPHQSTLTRP
jgi:hypothetical protein